MKNVIRLGLVGGVAAALVLFGNAQAAGNEPGTTPYGGAAGTPSGAGANKGGTASSAGESRADKKLQERLERLHAMNQAEVEMGQLGSQNAQSPEVKQFAEQMREDHQKADQSLSQLAQSAGFASLEGKTFQKMKADTQKEVQKLQSKSGKDFDKAFMSRMVDDHNAAIKEAKSGAEDARKANHAQVASALEQMHTGMQGHLAHAKQVESAVRREAKAGGAKPGGTAGGDTGTSEQTAPPGGAGGQPGQKY